jgi:hypothetical protein
MSNVEVFDVSPRPPLPSLRPLNLTEFLTLDLPPRRPMLAPWLPEKGTAMIYSPRGVGKTLLAVQDWTLAHRRAGRSLVFVHHAGKGGGQRGTSKREDVLDSVIVLRHPQDYCPDQGARFEVHFEKHRGFHGADADPFEALYEEGDGTAIWTRATIADADLKRVAHSIREGMSIRETAQELGMHRSRVERLRAKAKDQGVLND